jgi:hypothetical protein
VDEKILQAAFIPFGETTVNMPLDYTTGMFKFYSIYPFKSDSILIIFFLLNQQESIEVSRL